MLIPSLRSAYRKKRLKPSEKTPVWRTKAACIAPSAIETANMTVERALYLLLMGHCSVYSGSYKVPSDPNPKSPLATP